MDNFRVIEPSAPRVPLLLSIPHCGTEIPGEVRGEFVPELIEDPDDTDWYLDQLYSFAPSLGITVISAVVSRWVIDLNRHPDGEPLYGDGRIITGLCPVTTFLGQPLYRDSRTSIAAKEIQRRKKEYFRPYHQKLQELLSGLKSEFGSVLLWDCHSIRQVVPTIQAQRFPDLILGSADGVSAHPSITAHALEKLGSGKYTITHNHPFKGGFITRAYGRPSENQHALQLEMCKVNYMDDAEKSYHPSRAKQVGTLLFETLQSLSKVLISMKD